MSSQRSRLSSKAQTENDIERENKTKRIDVQPEELGNTQEIIDFLDEESFPREVLKVDHIQDFGSDPEGEISFDKQVV